MHVTSHAEASLLLLGAIGIRVKRADVAALVLPRHVAQTDGGRVQGRFREGDLSTVRHVDLLTKPLAVGCQVLYWPIFEKPLPCDLQHTRWETKHKCLQRTHGRSDEGSLKTAAMLPGRIEFTLSQ